MILHGCWTRRKQEHAGLYSLMLCDDRVPYRDGLRQCLRILPWVSKTFGPLKVIVNWWSSYGNTIWYQFSFSSCVCFHFLPWTLQWHIKSQRISVILTINHPPSQEKNTKTHTQATGIPGIPKIEWPTVTFSSPRFRCSPTRNLEVCRFQEANGGKHRQGHLYKLPWELCMVGRCGFTNCWIMIIFQMWLGNLMGCYPQDPNLWIKCSAVNNYIYISISNITGKAWMVGFLWLKWHVSQQFPGPMDLITYEQILTCQWHSSRELRGVVLLTWWSLQPPKADGIVVTQIVWGSYSLWISGSLSLRVLTSVFLDAQKRTLVTLDLGPSW